MKIEKWPPPEGIKRVIAEIDKCWIEVNCYPHYITKLYDWTTLSPVTLSSHGCGCCSDPDPTPTRWFAIPDEGDEK